MTKTFRYGLAVSMALLFFGAARQSAALDFYVDGVNGTDQVVTCPPPCVVGTGVGEPFNNACKTIQRAIDAAAACGPGPHRIFINEGFYNLASPLVVPGSANTSGGLLRGIGKVVLRRPGEHVLAVSATDFTVESLEFETASSGGVIFAIGVALNNTRGTVRYCTFRNNNLGLRIAGINNLVESNEFFDNDYSIGLLGASNSDIRNNTFAFNGLLIAPNGGGLFLSGPGWIVRNNVIYGNTSGFIGQGATGTLESNDFSANTVADKRGPGLGDPLTGFTEINTTTADPLFVNSAGRIFLLQSASPLVGTGAVIDGQQRSIGARGVGVLARGSSPTDFSGWLVNPTSDSGGSDAFGGYVLPTNAGSCVINEAGVFKLKTACTRARLLSEVYDLNSLAGGPAREPTLRSFTAISSSDLSQASGSRRALDADSTGDNVFSGTALVGGLPFTLTSPTSSREIRLRTSASTFTVNTLPSTLPFSKTTFSSHRFSEQDRYAQFELVLRRDAE